MLVDYFFFSVVAYVENFTPSIPSNSRVIVNRMIYRDSPVKRWDLVYMENQNNSNEHVIRRVLGLPNEKILLKNGDVFINDQLQQKPFELQKGLWVKQMSLNDLLFRRVDLDQIFINLNKNDWQINPDGSLMSKPTVATPFAIQQKTFQKLNTDHKTIDIALEFDFTFNEDGGRFQLVSKYYQKAIALNMPSAIMQKNAHLQEERKIIHSLSKHIFKTGIKYKITLWLFDHKLALFVDNKHVFDKSWSATIKPEEFGDTNLFFIADQASIKIENLQIYRDISFEANGRYGCEKDTPHQILAHEVFVSTDHTGSSQTDSRTIGGININKFIKGKAIMTFYPNPFEWIY